MMGFKKKLSSLLPADTRNQLQNVLTVEWEGQNKTVLVDLPSGSGSGSAYDNEVEMSGLTGSAAGVGAEYGRLADDDEDEIYGNNRQNRNRPQYDDRDRAPSSTRQKKHSSYSSKVLPPLPPRQADHPAPPHGAYQQTTSNQPGFGGRNLNPFEPEYHSPQPSSSSTYSYSSHSQSPYTGFTPTFSAQSQFQEYSSGSVGSRPPGGGGGGAKENPWGVGKYRADDIDFLGEDTTDRETRDRDRDRDRHTDDNRNPFA